MPLDSHAHLDHVLLILGLLYKTFSSESNDISTLTCSIILGSLEKWWGKADQDAFILALFFNPFICTSLYKKNHPSLIPAGFYSIVKWMWEHIFPGQEHSSELYSATIEYYNGSGCWSD